MKNIAFLELRGKPVLTVTFLDGYPVVQWLLKVVWTVCDTSYWMGCFFVAGYM